MMKEVILEDFTFKWGKKLVEGNFLSQIVR
jgi:hypothetical protein